MNIGKIFDPLMVVVISTSAQLGVIGTREQDLVISFHFVEGESLNNSTLELFKNKRKLFVK